MANNLYALFGLTADAHPDVIRAAYRALAKQYHPDGAGSGSTEATSKFIELQEAYEILGNPERRAEYDASISPKAGEQIGEEQEASIDPDEIWQRRAQEHPEIDHVHSLLFSYSPALGNRFRLAVINDECGDDPAGFAADLDRAYFEKYFGKDPDVQALARKFLSTGNRVAAKNLNESLKNRNISGSDELRQLIRDFEMEYGEGQVSEEHPAEVPSDPSRLNPRETRSRLPILIGMMFITLGMLASYLYISTPHSQRDADQLEVPSNNDATSGKVSLTEVNVAPAENSTDKDISQVITKNNLPYTEDKAVIEETDINELQANESVTTITKQVPSEPVHETFSRWPSVSLSDSLTQRGVSFETASALVDAINSVVPVSSIPTNSPLSWTLDRQIDFNGREIVFPTLLALNLGSQTITVTFDQEIGFTASASGAKRVALVIGNANYRKLSWLSNPDEDATSVANALANLGFDVTRLTDATEQEMKSAVSEFSRSLTSTTEMALIFYSGHAVELDSRNYLLPVDVSPKSSRERIASESISLSELIQAMQDRAVRTKVIIVDACRDNPFGQTGITSRGLAAVVAPSDTFVAYSTAPGTLALDGAEGEKNSPYSAALTSALKTPAASIEDTFKEVRTEVMRLTNGQQVPWDGSSLVGTVSFASDLNPTNVRDFRSEAPLENSETIEVQEKRTFNDLSNAGGATTPSVKEPITITSTSGKKQIYDRVIGDQDVSAPVLLAPPKENIPKSPSTPQAPPPRPFPVPGSDQQGFINFGSELG